MLKNKRFFVWMCFVILVTGILAGCSGNTKFIVQKQHGYSQGSEQAEGQLVIENNYLRLKTAEGKSYLLVWPHGYTVETAGGTTEVKAKDGLTFAKVNDTIQVEGQEITAATVRVYTGAAAPKNQEPFWLVAPMKKPAN